jgi:hypothetical protein
VTPIDRWLTPIDRRMASIDRWMTPIDQRMTSIDRWPGPIDGWVRPRGRGARGAGHRSRPKPTRPSALGRAGPRGADERFGTADVAGRIFSDVGSHAVARRWVRDGGCARGRRGRLRASVSPW